MPSTRVVLSGDEDTVGASLYFSCGSAWAESDVEKGVYRMIQVRIDVVQHLHVLRMMSHHVPSLGVAKHEARSTVVFVFLLRRSHSISFTRAQGIPKSTR